MSTDPNAPICWYYQQGKCSFGNACRNRHVRPDQSQGPSNAPTGPRAMQGFSNPGFGSSSTGVNAFGQPQPQPSTSAFSQPTQPQPTQTASAFGPGGFGAPAPANAGFGGGSTSGNSWGAGPAAAGGGGGAPSTFGAPQGGANLPAPGMPTFDPQALTRTMPQDARDYLHGSMWPLTSYGVAKYEPNLIENRDLSPEEVRLEYYKLRQQPGGLQQYEYMWNNIYTSTRAQYSDNPHQLAQMLAAAERLHRARYGSSQPPPKQPPQAGATSAFGPGGMGAPQQQVGALGLAGMQPQGGTNAFGQPQPATNAFGQPQPQPQPTTNAFGQPQLTNAFGQPQQGVNAFGQPQTNAFSQPQPTTNAFGRPQTQQVQSAFGPGGSGPAQNTFGQKQPPQQQQQQVNAFGQPIQPQTGTNAFGQPQPQQGTNAFGQPQPQQQGTNAFGQPQQPAQNAFTQPQPQQPAPGFGQPAGGASAFGPGGSGPPPQDQAVPLRAPVGFGQPQPQPQPQVAGQQPSTQGKISVRYRQRPIVPELINPFVPGKDPWTPGPLPSFDPQAGSLLPDQVKAKFGRPTWPETDAARRGVVEEWGKVDEPFRKECEEVWKAEKFEWGKIPALPPPSEYR